jgi:hypothetical protein
MVPQHSFLRSDGFSPRRSEFGSAPQSLKAANRCVARALVASPPSPEKTKDGRGASEKPSTLTVKETREENGIWLWETTKSLAGGLYGLLRIDKLGWSAEGISNRQEKAELLGDTTQRAVKVYISYCNDRIFPKQATLAWNLQRRKPK